MKSVDVDTLLAESELELKLGGRIYKIKDVPMTTFMTVSKKDAKRDPDLPHKQLASILGVKVEILKTGSTKVGIKAAGLALGAIMKWLAERGDEDEPKQEGESKSEDPTT